MAENIPHINFYSYPSRSKEFNDFLNVYYPVMIIIPPDQPIKNLKAPQERRCKFCQKQFPDVTFGKEAHILPRSLGNRFLISDFECDTCNELFGKYENDLNNWLGIIRTMSGTKGRNGIPTFTSVNQQLKAKVIDFLGTKATKIAFKDSSDFHFDDSTGQTKFEFKKGPYTPIRIYKSLLKMALSFIPINDRQDYGPSFDFLMGEDNDEGFQAFAKVICHNLSMEQQVIKPCVLLFERIDHQKKIPKHFFILYYENFSYSFPLPFNLEDWKCGVYKYNYVDILYPPPILFTKPDDLSQFVDSIEDFGSCEKRVNEVGSVYLNTSLPDFKDLVSYNPKTGEMQQADMKSIKIAGIYMVPNGTNIDVGEKFDLP